MTLGTLANSGPGCGGWGHQLLVSWKSERVSNLNISLIERQRSSALLQPTALWTSLCCSLSTIGSQIPSNINNAPLQFGHRCTLLLIIFGEGATTVLLTTLEWGKKGGWLIMYKLFIFGLLLSTVQNGSGGQLDCLCLFQNPQPSLYLKSNCHHDIIRTKGPQRKLWWNLRNKNS